MINNIQQQQPILIYRDEMMAANQQKLINGNFKLNGFIPCVGITTI